jgi:hypothetical protein
MRNRRQNQAKTFFKVPFTESAITGYLTKPAPVPALIAALRDASFQSTLPAAPDEAIVLMQHHVALLKKLEDKNATLEQTAQKLERAHERIAGLSKAKVELRAAPAHVKRLAGLDPSIAVNPPAFP